MQMMLLKPRLSKGCFDQFCVVFHGSFHQYSFHSSFLHEASPGWSREGHSWYRFSVHKFPVVFLLNLEMHSCSGNDSLNTGYWLYTHGIHIMQRFFPGWKIARLARTADISFQAVTTWFLQINAQIQCGTVITPHIFSKMLPTDTPQITCHGEICVVW